MTSYEELYPQVRIFFAPLTGVVQDFASKHGLMIEKYEKDAPVWSLLFRHPKGGVAKIDLEQLSDAQGLRVGLYWWIDDFDAGLRRYKWREASVLVNPFAELPKVLDSGLSEILARSVEDLSPSASADLGTHWRKVWTKKQFERLNDRYPKLKV